MLLPPSRSPSASDRAQGGLFNSKGCLEVIMSKPIVEECTTCQGRHVVEVVEKCWDCRGKGKKYKSVKKRCRACNATGRYVRKIGEHNHKVTSCNRCEGKGHHIIWVVTEEACPTCGGSGKFHKKRRCKACKGKGRTTINTMNDFWPDNAKKILRLA